MTWGKLGVAQLGEAVPRAASLAVVATVNAIANQGAEFLGDGASQLYGQVGNTASGINFVWSDDGPGWAGIEAGVAGAAVIINGWVGGRGKSQ